MKKMVITTVFLFLPVFVVAQPPTPSPTPAHSAEQIPRTRLAPTRARFIVTFAEYIPDAELFNAPIPDKASVRAGQTYTSRTFLRSTVHSQYQEIVKKGTTFVRVLWFILAGLGVLAVLGSFIAFADGNTPFFVVLLLAGSGMIVPVFATTDWNALHSPNSKIYFDNAGDSPATVVIDGKEMFTVNPKSYAAAEFYKDDLGGKSAEVEIVILSADKTERERSVQRVETYSSGHLHFIYNIGQTNQYWEETADYGDNPFPRVIP